MIVPGGAAEPWFAVLLDPVRGRLEAAWRRLPARLESPRAGLGGAIVVHVARGWGTRRWQEAGRVAVAVIEGIDQELHRLAETGAPDEATRAAWLTADAGPFESALRRAAHRDEALLRRVAARVLAGAGERPVPEAVGFLRAAVAAGVIAGDVPDGVHAALDRWAEALGEAMAAGFPGSGARPPGGGGASRATGGLGAGPAERSFAAAAAAGERDERAERGDAREREAERGDARERGERGDARGREAERGDARERGVLRAEGGANGFLAAAAAALGDLPECDARERFLAVVAGGAAGFDAGGADGARPHVAGTDAAVGSRRPPASGRSAPALFARTWEPILLPASPPPEDALEAALVGAFPGDAPLPVAARWLAARGGKRLRAHIALAAAHAVGGDAESAMTVATAVEWVHTASLVLDDIIDEADLRRGEPPLHQAGSVPFAAGVAGWVLARLLLDAPEPARLADTLVTLARGQRDELARAGDREMALADWYAIAAAKTARLFVHAAAGGGAAAGATTRQRRALARYGQELGLAFQIVDDLLDVVGDERELGKRPGQDLRTGRVTYPLLLVRDLDPGALDDEEALLAAIGRHGIAARCRTRAEEHRDRAVAALAELPGDTSELVALATRCVQRRA